MVDTMMTGGFLEVTRSGPIATVRFDREGQRNALNAALLDELGEAISLLKRDSGISVVVLTGGSKYFSAGADRKDPGLFEQRDAGQYRRGLMARSEITRAWAELPQITIAAIEGYAVGGGLTFALCSDFRVMATDAFIYVPEIDIGMPYGWSSLPRLMSLAGPSVTRRLVILAERIPAGQALEWRLIDYVADPGKATASATELAQRMAAKPALVLEIHKRTIGAVQTAMAQLISHADSDQAVLCRLAREAATGQSQASHSNG